MPKAEFGYCISILEPWIRPILGLKENLYEKKLFGHGTSIYLENLESQFHLLLTPSVTAPQRFLKIFDTVYHPISPFLLAAVLVQGLVISFLDHGICGAPSLHFIVFSAIQFLSLRLRAGHVSVVENWWLSIALQGEVQDQKHGAEIPLWPGSHFPRQPVLMLHSSLWLHNPATLFACCSHCITWGSLSLALAYADLSPWNRLSVPFLWIIHSFTISSGQILVTPLSWGCIVTFLPMPLSLCLECELFVWARS